MASKTVLIIENDPGEQEVMIMIIHTVAPTSECYAVYSSDDAIKLLDEGDFIPDLIFCNNRLKNASIPDVIGNIRKHALLKHTPFVITDTRINEEEGQKLESEGAAGVLIKGTLSQMYVTLNQYFIGGISSA